MERLAHIGLTDVYKHRSFAVVSHGGNMGNNIDNVRKNVDALYGTGMFDRLRQHGEESGSPDYLYELKVPYSKFLYITTGAKARI